MSNQGLVTLDPAGVPATVNYNVPEPVSYDGVNIVELDVEQELFRPAPVKQLTLEQRRALPRDRVLDAMKRGFDNVQLFPDLGVPPGFLTFAEVITDDTGKSVAFNGCFVTRYGALESERLWTTEALRKLDVDTVWVNLSRGLNLRIVRLPSHRWDIQFVNAEDGLAEPRKRLAVLEYYRLSSFLGQYGAGQTVNTFSLLPGERTRISIKTYKRTTTNEQRSSSILDSLTDESSADFEDALQEERSERANSARSDSWHVEAELSASFGIGSASVKAGYQGSASSSREQFARSVSNSLQKHASKASNRRDITVEQTSENTSATSFESTTERELKNINVSRTLNFVFRQMNQEFITLLHLTDIRVGYTDGITTKVVPLHELDELLEQFLITKTSASGSALPEREQPRTALRDGILAEFRHVTDHEGKRQTVLESANLTARDGKVVGTYTRFKKGMTSTFESRTTGSKFAVDGVILSATTNVLRTDGVVTEALLGGANGLDPYSQGLQQQALVELDNRNTKLEQGVELERFAHDIVRRKDGTAASLLLTMFPPRQG